MKIAVSTKGTSLYSDMEFETKTKHRKKATKMLRGVGQAQEPGFGNR